MIEKIKQGFSWLWLELASEPTAWVWILAAGAAQTLLSSSFLGWKKIEEDKDVSHKVIVKGSELICVKY